MPGKTERLIDIDGEFESTDKVRREILALRSLVMEQNRRIFELEGREIQKDSSSAKMAIGNLNGKKIIFDPISCTIFEENQSEREIIKTVSPLRSQILATFIRYKGKYIPGNSLYRLATGEESCLCTPDNIRVHISGLRFTLRTISPQLANRIKTLPGGYMWSEEEEKV